MTSLKAVHVSFGIVLLALGIFNGAILLQLYPHTYPDSSAIELFVQPINLLLIACASLNLVLGAHLNSSTKGLRSVSSALGSLLILVSAVILAAQQFAQSGTSSPQLQALAIGILASGAILHYLAQRPPMKVSTPRTSTDTDQSREAGEVKWFNVSKGFGFITRDSGDDIFVHFRAIRGEGHRTLTEGQRVDFIVNQRDKGLQAEDVVPM